MNGFRSILALPALLLSLACARVGEGADAVPEEGVRLSLALSVAGTDVPSTKMSATVTQSAAGEFRGIEQVNIIPFRVPGRSTVEAEDSRLSANLPLQQAGLPAATFGPDAARGSFAGLVSGSNAHLYKMTLVPGGTNATLVYGKALDQPVAITDSDSVAFKQRNGVLRHSDLHKAASASDITFSPEPFLYGAHESEFKTWRRDIVLYLNQIVQVWVNNSRVSEVYYRFSYPEDYGNHPALKAALEDFSHYGKMAPGTKEVLDGRLTRLYRAVYPYQDAHNSLEYHDNYYYYVSELAKAVITKINDSKYVTISGSGTNARVALKLDGPAHLGLPYGSFALQYREGSHKFEETLDNKDGNTGQRVGIYTTDERHFTYPPALWYYSNGPLCTSEEEDVAAYYKTETGTWADILAYYPEDRVTTSSRAAAIKEPLQYGVACMVLQLQKASANNLADSRGEMVAVNNTRFPLTGVLVAGQKAVDYAFRPVTTAQEYIVYDTDVSGAYLSQRADSSPVYTLLLQSEAGKNVRFALEFLNTGPAFHGLYDCEIETGMHFYLLGEIVYTPDGTIPSVFNQDRTATVKVRFTDFKNAQAVLPDIRQIQLSIGLEAILDWYQTPPQSIEIK